MAAPPPNYDEQWYSWADRQREIKDKDNIKIIDGFKIEFK